ncbi:MAG: L,D-transpeptidase family protein [Burkholderiales bacterium]|nr:L,D-transpeptidase family protein [Burkholderiales bacterium]
MSKFAIAGFLTAACTMTLLSARAHAGSNNAPAEKPDITRIQNMPSPDALLIEVYQLLAQNELNKAQVKIDALLSIYPNFQLAHLIRGDLISMRTRPLSQFGAATAANSASADRLKDLRDEAQARIRAITERPVKDFIPDQLLQMSDEQKYALVMDAKRARLFLYENIKGIPSLISDFYVSQGKFGIDKFKEGDQRTPLGVYYITNRLPGTKLPDFYGPGALPLSYPNEWDKSQGRSGSGIWLHGVPSSNYSRPPLASDGCVVLSNPDFLKIAATVDIAKTPVIISDKINFISRAAWLTEKQSARKLIEDWRLDISGSNPNQLARHYSRNFKNNSNEALTAWLSKQVTPQAGSNAVALRDISQFRYPGKSDMIVSNFIQDSSTTRGTYSVKRHQYWLKEANQWHIIFEEATQISGAKIEFDIAKEQRKDMISASTKEPIKTVVTAEKIDRRKTTDLHDKNKQAQSEVLKAVDRWVNAWSSKNTGAYLAHYARDFQTPNGESRKSWMEERRGRIEGKAKIKLTLESPTVSVEGNNATVKFRQHYQSGALVASSRKTLVLVKQDGKWLIRQERTGS